MSTHNICFCGEIRKILCGYPLLSGAIYLIREFAVYICTVEPQWLEHLWDHGLIMAPGSK